MIKEYVANFSYLSITVMILFFTLFWFLVYQTLKIGRQKSEEFSHLPIEAESNHTEEMIAKGISNG